MVQQRRVTNVDTDIAGIVRTTRPLLDAIVPAKQPVRATTTAALPANTRTGNVLTASANGVIPAQDGVTLVVGDRLLVKDEATGANNGPFTVTDLGSAGTPWVLTRSIDADESAKIMACINIFVEEGTANAEKMFVLTTDNPITINVTALVFAEMSAGGVSDLQGAYDGGNDVTVVSGTPVQFRLDAGSLPALSADTVLVLANTSAVGDNVELSLISGTNGRCIINFGDTADEDVAFIEHFNNGDTMTINVNGTLDLETFSANYIKLINGTGIIFNSSGISSVDVRIEGDTLPYMFFTDATNTTENIALLTTAAPNWQTMDRGLFWGDVTTAPTGNPASGLFMWSATGVLNIRQSDGTTFAVGPGGGNTLDQAYDQGGAGAGRIVEVTGGTLPVQFRLDTGSLPALGSNTAFVLSNTSAAADSVTLSIISGASGASSLFFGDTANEDAFSIVVDHSSDVATIGLAQAGRWDFRDNAGLQYLSLINSSSGDEFITVNDGQSNRVVFLVKGNSLTHMIFTDPTPANENIAFLTGSQPNWQTMDRGLFIGDVTTAPTAQGTAGLFMWSAASILSLAGGMVVNELGLDADTRMESNNSTNMFFVDAGNDRVVMQKDNGSLPAISADVALVLANNSVTSDNVEMSLISGTFGDVRINFGDTDNEDVGELRWDSLQETLDFTINGSFFQRWDGAGQLNNRFNFGSLDMDFQVSGATLLFMLFLEGNAASENLAFLTDSVPNWQTMDRGFFLGDATTLPTAAPAAGTFLYGESGFFREHNVDDEIGDMEVMTRRRIWAHKRELTGTTLDDSEGAGTMVTTTGTASDGSDADGTFGNYASAAVIDSDAGWQTAYTKTRRDHKPIWSGVVKTGAAITVVRYMVGLTDADPMGSATPLTNLAAFRYDTVADGTAFWRCITNDGTTTSLTTTTIAITTSTKYNLRIDCSTTGEVRFYINGVLAATHTANLPTATTSLGTHLELRTLEGVAKSIEVGKFEISDQ